MRKEQFTTPVANGNNYKNFAEKKQSWTDNFVTWFHRFLESAE